MSTPDASTTSEDCAGAELSSETSYVNATNMLEEMDIAQPGASAAKEGDTTASSGSKIPPLPTVESLVSMQPVIMNRFSSWRDKSREMIRKTATEIRNSNTTTVATSFLSGSIKGMKDMERGSADNNAQPLQEAQLSPASSPAKPALKGGNEQPKSQVEENSEEDNTPEIEIRESHSTDSYYDDNSYEDSSAFGSSVFTDDTSSYYDSTTSVARAVWARAATSVVDSVQQNFRGRYTTNTGSPSKQDKHQDKTAPSTPTVASANPSQTARILASPQGPHLQSILTQLPSHHYVLLLGRGRLGVTLQSTFRYLQDGVYVDDLVAKGAAHLSGVVRVGDALIRVGEEKDVRTQTIATVPEEIAVAPRPVPIVISTAGTREEDSLDRYSHVDVAVGVLYYYYVAPKTDSGYSKVDDDDAVTEASEMKGDTTVEDSSPLVEEKPTSEEDVKKKQETEGGTDNSDEKEEAETEDQMELLTPTSFDKVGNPQGTDLTVPLLSATDQLIHPGIPDIDLRKKLAPHFLKRNTDLLRTEEDQIVSRESLLELIAQQTPIRNALRNALVLCVRDGRRMTQLSKHLATWDETAREADKSEDSLDPTATENSAVSLLALLTELLQFIDLYDALPQSLPQRIKVAERIALKYFLPTPLGSNQVVPPVIDFHGLVSASAIRNLETALKGQTSDSVSRDIFDPFLQEAANRLAHSDAFVSFMTSNDCARMRAYLRHTAPFVTVSLPSIVAYAIGSDTNPKFTVAARNYLNYWITFLLCRTEAHDFPFAEKKPRIHDTAMGLCAAIALRSQVLVSLVSSDSIAVHKLRRIIYTLSTSRSSRSTECEKLMSTISMHLSEISVEAPDVPAGLVDATKELADTLLYDCAYTWQSAFRRNQLHELICEEMLQCDSNTELSVSSSKGIPSLAKHCIKRLLRKVDWPVGVAPHKPSHDQISEVKSDNDTDDATPVSAPLVSAECALIFGNLSPDEKLRRYTSCSLHAENCMSPASIAPTVESYAMVPLSRGNPLVHIKSDECQASLISFSIPQGKDSDGSSLYGVSLLLQRSSFEGKVQSSITNCDLPSHMQGIADLNPKFGQRLSMDQEWRQGQSTHQTRATVGIALVSERNVILSMRETLSQLLYECPSSRLFHVLGCFSQPDTEEAVLTSLLSPYINQAAKPWLERPISAQHSDFSEQSLQQLLACLPPIPFTLLFLASLLEQKIVLTSSRRSLLLSATTALSELLQPLKWCHLLVPRVPASLASDLLQYPAPFILGMASEDPGILDLIRELPNDVTLVDLDVGRVILASSLTHEEGAAQDLRSQVLYLSQSLGNVLGPQIDPDVWQCDSPFAGVERPHSRTQGLRQVCRDFVEELVADVASCCYWLEESYLPDDENTVGRTEPTVLLDEDQFYHVKRLRHQNDARVLSLAVDDFDLVLAQLLRCQNMNEYIGSRPKRDMAFCL